MATARHVALLTQLVVCVQAILDPQLIVLGGGTGSRLAPLLPDLIEHLERATPLQAPRVQMTVVGDDGPLTGALHRARGVAWRRRFDATAGRPATAS